MKKRFRSLTCLLVVVSLLCVFSINASALTDEMTHVYDSGSVRFLNKTCNYITDTAASRTSASATITSDIVASLGVHIRASLSVQNELQFNQSSEIAQSTTASASVTDDYNDDGVLVDGVITAAVGTYNIGAYNSFVSSVE